LLTDSLLTPIVESTYLKALVLSDLMNSWRL